MYFNVKPSSPLMEISVKPLMLVPHEKNQKLYQILVQLKVMLVVEPNEEKKHAFSLLYFV